MVDSSGTVQSFLLILVSWKCEEKAAHKRENTRHFDGDPFREVAKKICQEARWLSVMTQVEAVAGIRLSRFDAGTARGGMEISASTSDVDNV
jgi:hypothetical protein